jgi:PTS system nitrogen regulatory IIA component
MDFASLLPPAAVMLDSAATTRRTALERLARLLAQAAGTAPTAVLAALLAREETGMTGFGDGTAIPHGRLPGLTRSAAAVLRLAHPVDWGAVDGMPVDLVIGLIGPEEAGAEPLKALALVSRSLRDRALVAKMRGATDAAALWTLLAGQARAAA